MESQDDRYGNPESDQARHALERVSRKREPDAHYHCPADDLRGRRQAPEIFEGLAFRHPWKATPSPPRQAFGLPPARSAQSRARYPVTVRGRSPEDGLEPVDAQPEAILEISVARVVDALERDHAVIPVRAQRIRHRLELVGELTFAQSADLQRGARGVDLHILDVDVAEIAILHRIVTVRPGRFVTPAVVR